MKKTSFLIPILVFLMLPLSVFAQEIDTEFDYNSLRPIRKSDVMYLNTLWMRMDMREKQNEAFFAEGNQVTKIMIDAVKAGVLRPFTDDKLESRMSLNEFLENLKMPSSEIDDDPFKIDGEGGEIWPDEGTSWPSDGESWTDEGDGGSGGAEIEEATAEADEFFAKQMPILEFKTNLVFDKKRSRMYREIESITIVIPGEYYASGIDKKLATFSYKELVENVFVDNPQATWYNAQNVAEHRNLADAFDLAMESARIIKYANPRDAYVEDIYNGDLKVALGKSLEYGYSMMEKESNAWSN